LRVSSEKGSPAGSMRGRDEDGSGSRSALSIRGARSVRKKTAVETFSPSRSTEGGRGVSFHRA